MPLAQIPASAIAATIFRANVPTAIGSTLVTNPVTFAPIYVIAYKVGVVLLGKTPNKDSLEKVSKELLPLIRLTLSRRKIIQAFSTTS